MFTPSTVTLPHRCLLRSHRSAGQQEQAAQRGGAAAGRPGHHRHVAAPHHPLPAAAFQAGPQLLQPRHRPVRQHPDGGGHNHTRLPH